MPADFGPGRFGLTHGPASPATTETRNIATADPDDFDGRLLSAHNPLAAFAVLGAITFGLMAFSTSVRVGKTRAALSIGDTK